MPQTAVIVVSGLGHATRRSPLYPVAQALKKNRAHHVYHIATRADRPIAKDAQSIEALVKGLLQRGVQQFVFLGHSKGCYAIRQANLQGIKGVFISVSAGPHSRYGPENVKRGAEHIQFDANKVLEDFNPEKENPLMQTLHIHLKNDALAMHEVFEQYNPSPNERITVVDAQPSPLGKTRSEQALNRHNWRGLKGLLVENVLAFLLQKIKV